MPKKIKVNKSEVIRDYYAKKPDAKPSEIVAALKKKGIKVSAQQVSTTRINAIKTGRLVFEDSRVVPQKPGKRGRPANPRTNVTVDDLVEAKRLVELMGGIENAKRALSALDMILE